MVKNEIAKVIIRNILTLLVKLHTRKCKKKQKQSIKIANGFWCASCDFYLLVMSLSQSVNFLDVFVWVFWILRPPVDWKELWKWKWKFETNVLIKIKLYGNLSEIWDVNLDLINFTWVKSEASVCRAKFSFLIHIIGIYAEVIIFRFEFVLYFLRLLEW